VVAGVRWAQEFEADSSRARDDGVRAKLADGTLKPQADAVLKGIQSSQREEEIVRLGLRKTVTVDRSSCG
jgi:hypothetical protein